MALHGLSSTCIAASGDEDYVGRWDCATKMGDFFEIKANKGAFLVTDEGNDRYYSSLDDAGTLNRA
jgi:hypothetical protein